MYIAIKTLEEQKLLYYNCKLACRVTRK